ncbi:cation diffusion facilitator family transporter [Romboutsia lituseburensis]|uniref:Cation diffusion facilitator family transporter n=1 Tax=Romboutsia lituseburensis DSM 797 TaxID=1121325 RepID=A0A1G9SP44_9FIRM|nr:cation diffusion facilitator family transporter [Romboutsia lituseburensis]CEH32990.1 Cation efflux protein [Romboutsia lituseburensis]SDM37216.1 cation diffusion facilitator family transporter [Romboutsia lituseburensis DSM 797]
MQNNNFKKIKQVLWIILFANFFVAILKIIVGTTIKSASMTADGFHSLSDGASNIVGIVGIGIASKPKDKEHPYGHTKYEVIASMFIGGMLLIIAGKIILTSISRISNPIHPTITTESLIALIITLCINIFVTTYENRIGKKLNSYILISDSMHTRSDIFVSIGVLCTLIGVKLGLPSIIDPIASLIVSGFIIYSAYEIFKSSTAVLVDQAIIDENEIENIVKTFEEVKGVHKIRNRGCGNDIHIDMHLLIDPYISIEHSHYLTHEIEDRIKNTLNKNVQVIVHLEPFYENRSK